MRTTNLTISIMRVDPSDTGARPKWRATVNGNRIIPEYGALFLTREEAVEAASFAAAKIYA